MRQRPPGGKAPAGRPGSQRLRIVGGQWRGRRIEFAEVAGVRPTPDRVRETLFNWLQAVTEGARCLDLFTGSGALGIEALSRGAAAVVMVDSNRRVIDTVREQLQRLQASGATLVEADVNAFLRTAAGRYPPFDVAFLDPPYGRGLLEECCGLLESGAWLAPGARVYLEAEAELGELALPPGWTLLRSKRAGHVGYHLAVKES